MRQVLIALGLSCAIGSYALAAQSGLKQTFEKAYAAAEAARSKAASVDGEWRDTKALLDSANAAAKKGDLEKAIALVEKARQQGELGYAQAVSQRNVGHPSYLR